MILLLIDLLKYLKKFEWYRNIWNWKTHICCTRTWIVSLLLQLKITNWTKYQVATWIWLCTSLQKDSNTDFFFDFLYFVYTDATNCLQQDHMLYKMSLDVQKLDRRDPTLWEMNKALVTGLNPITTQETLVAFLEPPAGVELISLVRGEQENAAILVFAEKPGTENYKKQLCTCSIHHTYMHACIHTYVRTYVHTYTHTYVSYKLRTGFKFSFIKADVNFNLLFTQSGVKLVILNKFFKINVLVMSIQSYWMFFFYF